MGTVLLAAPHGFCAGVERAIRAVEEAPGRIHLVDPDNPDPGHELAPEKVAWLSQTTLAVDDAQVAVGRLRERYPNLLDPPSDDICYASQNRQNAVRAIAPQCDVLLVVGSANSSNSIRLVEVALAAGARAAYLVDSAADIDVEWLRGIATVGLTSGASAPEELLSEVVALLAEHGHAQVRTVSVAAETLTFSLPPELRTGRS